MDTIPIRPDEAEKILSRVESHFADFKSKRISPAKLSRSISALANADGGELFVGVEDNAGQFQWDGFTTPEDANGLVQAIQSVDPSGVLSLSFLSSDAQAGLVLHVQIPKTRSIYKSTDSRIYLRKGAQNLPQTTDDQVRRLTLNKGLESHEDETVRDNIESISNSLAVIDFILEIIPHSEPEVWLRKQLLIVGDRPTVAGELLFNDEPQVVIPKASIKIYRYKTSDAMGTRETLDFQPISIDGNLYEQIRKAVTVTVDITETSQVLGQSGLQNFTYPKEAIHEIITNSVLHRDYSLNDDVHVRIFENRIEVESPGTLPAHVTERNILKERFARNPKMVRLINKFPDPPNKDVGEGLNTAFEAMRNLRLKPPVISQNENSVLVVLRHESLASAEETIVEYLNRHGEINNAKGREICHEGSENKMKRVFERMMDSQIIERIPNRRGRATAYRKKT